jgi:4-hydroxy-2-oxoheptanedioate aldolase
MATTTSEPVDGLSARSSPIRRWWREGRPTVGTWCGLPAPAAVEAVAQAGFDWVALDWQHGHFGDDQLGTMILVASHAGAVPLVRVPLNDPWLVQKALDLGAAGVIVPLVNTVAEAERAALACRYPPHGVRSFGPIRASRAVGWEPEVANREVVCIVQIETREALANVDAIAGVAGVDALFVGPADLAISLGLPLGSPELDQHLGPVFAAAATRSLPVGRHADTAAEARALYTAGYSFVAVGGDTEFLGAGAARVAAEALPRPRAENFGDGESICRLLVWSAAT